MTMIEPRRAAAVIQFGGEFKICPKNLQQRLASSQGINPVKIGTGRLVLTPAI